MARKPFRDSDDDKLREDTAETAFRTLQEAIGERPKTVPGAVPAQKNPAAVARGQRGGRVGGKARAAALSPRRLKASAKKAARARWEKPGGK